MIVSGDGSRANYIFSLALIDSGSYVPERGAGRAGVASRRGAG